MNSGGTTIVTIIFPFIHFLKPAPAQGCRAHHWAVFITSQSVNYFFRLSNSFLSYIKSEIPNVKSDRRNILFRMVLSVTDQLSQPGQKHFNYKTAAIKVVDITASVCISEQKKTFMICIFYLYSYLMDIHNLSHIMPQHLFQSRWSCLAP